MILFLSALWPEPESSAAGTRTWELVRGLRNSGVSVSFAATAPERDSESSHRQALESLGVQTWRTQPNDPDFDEKLAQLRPMCVVFDRFMLEEQFGWRVRAVCPEAVRVLDTSDLHLLRRARMRQAEHVPGVVPGGSVSAISGWQTEDAWRELASILRSDRAWVVSWFEREWLLAQGVPAGQVEVVPLSVAHSRTMGECEGERSDRERIDFVSIGNFRHPPNWDSVLWLSRELWPAIREAFAERVSGSRVPELHVYGAYPSREAMALDDPKRGFRVLGHADQAIPTLQRYRILLAPLRYGAGVKGKVLDAWAADCAVLTTSIGAEGMTPDGSFAGQVVDSPGEWPEAAVRLWRDAEERARLVEQGRALLERHYDPGRGARFLTTEIEKLLSRRDAWRQEAWLGSMLWHQTLRSTEFFSRWIEAKNAVRR